MIDTSISKKLLTRVLSVYFILTFVVTCGHIVEDYFNAKSHIQSELLTIEKTFSGSLTRAVWELNTQQAKVIAEGLVSIPMIKGISVQDENGQTIAQMGEVASDDLLFEQNEGSSQTQNINSLSKGVFGHNFPLIFEFSGRATKVGTVTLLSNREVIFNRIEVGIYFLIGNAILKTAFLVFLFLMAFTQLLTKPLNELTEQINQFDIDDPESSKLHSVNYEKNELSILEDAYNNLVDQLVKNREELAEAQKEVLAANSKLDEQNLLLEQEVARKTSNLSTAMLEMEMQQRDLKKQQEKLKEENERRRTTEKTLMGTNKELKKSISELNKAEERLLEAEKMAALGGLAAEVSHEINTPIGVGVTSTSYLSDLVHELETTFNDQKLTKKSIEDFIENAGQSISLLRTNLDRAVEMVSSFKQVAVDQTSDKVRDINLAKYVNEIIQSLHPKIKKTAHKVALNCEDDLNITCHAGAIAQIITNLVVNSLIHGFEGIESGTISIDAIRLPENKVQLIYKDNGIGLSSENMAQLFDPFYTSKENQGGSGLGTHIVFNLVSETLHGEIEADSELGMGLSYKITFPIS